jgi:hypothetical protein
MENMDRKRNQIVVSLPDGAEGKKILLAIDAAAKSERKPVATWAREKLLLAAIEFIIK